MASANAAQVKTTFGLRSLLIKASSVLLVILLLFQAVHEGQAAKQSSQKKVTKKSKKVDKKANFFVGKLDPAFLSVPYEELNGRLTPQMGRKMCEEDEQCAGFTYKGAKGLGQKFDLHFFRYIPEKAVEKAKSEGDWTWTSFKVSRKHVLLNIKEELIGDLQIKDKNIVHDLKRKRNKIYLVLFEFRLCIHDSFD